MKVTCSILQPYIFAEHGSKTYEVPYCHGSVTYDFVNPIGPRFIDCKPGSYEAIIENFIRRDFGCQPIKKDDLMILIGGIGTGKSTTLRISYDKIFSESRKCSNSKNKDFICDKRPILIKFDFNDLEGGDANDCEDNDNDDEKLWNFISACINGSLKYHLSVEEEVGYFWKWCLEQSRLLGNSIHLNKFFSEHDKYIDAFCKKDFFISEDETLNYLIRQRGNFFRESCSEAIAWYRVFSLAYALNNKKFIDENCNCLHLLFDNADHLTPTLQKKAVKFAILLTSILCARTIISIRPLTWEKSVHGHILYQEELHYSPGVCEVIAKRIDACISRKTGDLNELQIKSLEKLKEHFIGRDPHERIHHTFLSQLIESTSGISVRFALRNLCNMLASPIILRQPLGDRFLKDIKVSEITRALFFSDLDKINIDAFDNIYIVQGTLRDDQILIKPRILYFINYHQNSSTIAELFKFTEKFFYNENDVINAINSLLRTTRPLLWCENGYKINDTNSKGRIILTPIGYKYYESLYGELYYDEVCLAQNTNHSVRLEDIYDFHKRLTNQDIKEIKKCIDEFGSLTYHGFYPKDIQHMSMSLIHWRKLVIGLKKRDEKNEWSTLIIDKKRENWIINQIQKCLECNF